MTATRTGKISSKDATGTHFRDRLVRQLSDGTIEYHVGDSARSRDGYATLSESLVSQVVWDD